MTFVQFYIEKRGEHPKVSFLSGFEDKRERKWSSQTTSEYYEYVFMDDVSPIKFSADADDISNSLNIQLL